MKTKLVLWGTNAQNERLLIALELMPEENKVKAFTFPEQIATEEFSQLMLKEWRDGNAVEFPEGFSVEERELTLSGSILPDGVKAEREDIVQRAQTEWHFIVLSSRLYHTYHSELNEYKDRIEKALRFESGLWDELKGFWDKVQVQVRDRNLFREHADALRDRTNELFTSLKELRGKLDEEFERLSKDNYDRFTQMLTDVEKKVSDGLRLQPLFDDLKEMQRKFREAKLTKDHRTKIWDRLDLAFKVIKEKRFGTSSNTTTAGGATAAGDDRSPGERLNRRYEGLMSAIDKMEKSIKRDEDDLDFQKRKVANTDGQLEAQIRQAKILMIEERIRSKREKLGEMLQTREELDRRVETQKERDAKKAEQDKIHEAKRAAEEKIKSEIKAAADARKEDEDKLAKAAEQLKVEKGVPPVAKPEETPPPPAEESLFEAVITTVGDSVTDVVDTLKAVSEVVGDKIGDLVEDLKEAWENSAKTEEPEAAKEEIVEDNVAEEAAVEDKVEVEVEAIVEEEAVEEEQPSNPADEPKAENSTAEDEDAEKKDPIE
ncbi:hypothetical protein [Haliscomenobacter hydrossis]|uniref:Uncharacterized protein n=1 Tax=Haliscomenobacter hydrossis (strain ATCC 27775 / DSM 1100 / LMG 10767 / O) TaxID=760192 RepID=F4KV13_HALH1|nr:hypothetical protein [Haliscomenobacter hydrossis]AEE49179.1 hypothetical protein Halhy_1284 [Haliscomenobacter hydrossis DSM 1100]